MSRRIFQLLLVSVVLSLSVLAFAQKGEGPIDPAPPKGHTPDEIMKIVARKEADFKKARDNYTFRQDVDIEEMDGGTAVGGYKLVQDVLFDDRGRRTENVVFAPQNTLRRIQLMKEDEDDFRNIFSFVITPDLLPVYDAKYVGHQQVDELGTYVFDLKPIHMQKGQRYFEGRIWVDDQDLMVVKSSGIGVPNSKDNQPLPFTTWREQIDGKYWFPTYTKGQGNIKAYDHGHVVDETPVKAVVKYTDYKQYKATSTVTFGDVVDDPNQNQNQPKQTPQQAPQNQAPPK
ncbi:MAG TPA: hypothetical protein VGC88_02755 [Terriglobales bacterium]